MKKFQIYVETSVWNLYFDRRAAAFQKATQKFIDGIRRSNYELFISSVVIAEIAQAPQERKNSMLQLIEEVNPVVLELTVEADTLSQAYVESGALPQGSLRDANHIAIATVYQLDAIVSWNMKHIANVARKERVRALNISQGYLKELEMITPLEVSEYEV